MLLRSLIILNLLFITVSCADKDKGAPASTQESPESSSEETAIESEATTETSTKPAPPRVTRPAKPKPQPVEALDAEIAVLAQEVRNQLINDPKSEEKKSRNVQFANRIFKINYSHKKAALSFETHSKQTYNFHHTSSKSGVSYYNFYENNSKDLLLSSKTALFTASAKSVKSSNKNKQIVLIKIKDVTEDAVISVFYVIRSGKVTAIELEDIDYTKELTRTSIAFKDSLIEKPGVVGEFYGVITEADNNSSATRFSLTISDNFVLESLPMPYTEKTDEPQLIPLILSEKSWLKTACGLLCGSSVSHRSGRDFVYVNESRRKPVELKGLNIDLKLDAHERIKGQKNRVPLRLHVQF